MYGAVMGGRWGYFEGTGAGALIVLRNMVSKQSEFTHHLKGVAWPPHRGLAGRVG
jgi:hypothetical protein